MAARDDVEVHYWERLTERAQESFRWALAFETSPPVGSRGMLLGILQVGGTETPANILINHFGVGRAELAQALAEQNRSPLDPQAKTPRPMDELPTMTGNGVRCLALASQLVQNADGGIDIPEILGGLLGNERATATRALDGLIAIPIGDIAGDYAAYLRDGMYGSYRDRLELRFPLRPPSDTASPQPSQPSPDPLWARLMVLKPAANLGGYKDAQLGLLVDETTLATCTSGLSFGEFAVKTASPSPNGGASEGNDERLAFAVAQTGIDVTLLRSTAPLRLPAPPISFAEPQSSQSCELAALDSHSLAVTRFVGYIDSSLAAADSSFEISLSPQPQPRSSVLGSPVVVAGAIVGIVSRVSSSDTRIWATSASAVPLLTDASRRQRAIVGTRGGAGNDVVGAVDQLGFDCYVKAFVELITSENTQLPLTIGIFGSWGAGKSFLLRHIEGEIEARQSTLAKPTVHVLRFNAWEYSATEAIWPGLVRRIMTKLDEIAPCGWVTRMWTRVRWNLPRETRRVRVPLTAAALVFAAGAIVTAVADQAKLAALIGVAGIVSLGGGSLLKAANNPAARWVVGLFSDTSYGGETALMADIKHDLETLEARLHAHGDAGEPALGRIVILIDDLDRCEPAKAVEVLQAVNLLLNFNSFVVCLGIDARIVTAAIEAHYEGLLGRAGASGYEYLEKIVQIPFRIPTPGPEDLVRFVREQLGVERTKPDVGLASAPAPAENVESEERAPPTIHPPVTQQQPPTPVQQPGTPADVELVGHRPGDRTTVDGDPEAVAFTPAEQAAFELLTPYLRPNPRHVKRLVNVYRLVRALAQYHGDELVLADPAGTIRWLMMWAQWPYCSLMMIRRFDELRNAPDRAQSTPLPIGDPLQVLFSQVEKELDPKMSAQLDDPADNLRKLMAVDGCSLDWQQVQNILRYTVNFNPAVEEQLGGGV
jgi:hypothetical protein